VPDETTKFNRKRYDDIVQTAADESFHEMTGKKGDVILMHPLMLHSASKNGRRLIRTLTSFPSKKYQTCKSMKCSHHT
jgi:ectoine hydroxylase-related dioxygenase (phytanoyl-CoA dioxygenase family)